MPSPRTRKLWSKAGPPYSVWQAGCEQAVGLYGEKLCGREIRIDYAPEGKVLLNMVHTGGKVKVELGGHSTFPSRASSMRNRCGIYG